MSLNAPSWSRRLRPSSCRSLVSQFQRLRKFTSHRHLTLSTVEGAQEPPLDQRTLPEFFTNEILANHRARPALICSHELPRPHGGPLSRNLGVEDHLAWDFYEFDMNVSALARGLVGLGVKKGDRVAIVMGNNRYLQLLCLKFILLIRASSAYAMLQWACSIIGAISVTVNPAYRVNELVCMICISSCYVLILRTVKDQHPSTRWCQSSILGPADPEVILPQSSH